MSSNCTWDSAFELFVSSKDQTTFVPRDFQQMRLCAGVSVPEIIYEIVLPRANAGSRPSIVKRIAG